MTDAELVTLRGNAERLSKVAEEAIEEDQKQVTTAREVMSLVDVEVGDRKLKKKSSHPAAVEKSPRRGSAKAGV
ncbi:MAG: hypothetical protein HYR63_19330 [Proteobacteria bacterium]|nr:hypothetical protein [Pseudomonadota bacterium]